MKKTFVVLASGLIMMSAMIVGCGGSDNEQQADKDSAASAPIAEVKDPAIQEGLELAGKSDCFTCHRVTEAAIGPSYVDVAERYRNDANAKDSLVQKIIKGGSGNWGQNAMTPHAALPEADIQKMVTYILSLEKEG